MALTKRSVETVKMPGRYMDGRRDGLYLQVSKSGSKSWGQRLTIKGKRRDLGLGSFRFVTLAEAREAAFENQKIARRGGDPRADTRSVPTFAEGLEAVIALHAPSWKDKRAPATWRQSVRDHAKGLANMRVDAIEATDVLKVLTPLWAEKRKFARDMKMRIGAVLRWAVAQGYRTDDPMAAVAAVLPKNGGTAEHHRALAHGELGEALVQLRGLQGWPPVALALEFTALTACRSGEVRGATWAEIDLDERTWTIPADRMKTRQPHRVPLSARAVEVLEAAREFEDAAGRVFPSSKGGALPSNALTRHVEKAGLAGAMSVHGLRSSFRDWCAETGKPREIAEAALAHIVGGVEGAYFRSDLFERRRVLMEAWSDYLTGHAGAVVAFPA